ncbi:MAG: hypothetical protein Kow0027_14460 [Saprospiraceae bacterium]
MTAFHTILLLSSFLAAQRPGSFHDFKMSVCEMTFPLENEDLQLKFYLFQDDLKAALYDNPDAPNIDEEKAAAYIADHFKISVNGQVATLHFNSMRMKNDQVLLEFTCPGTRFRSPVQLGVHNTILVEQFRKQVNMVYLNAPGKDRITLMLHASKTDGTFSL